MESKGPEPGPHHNSSELIDKTEAQHDEIVTRVEENVGLRSDGDDLDHEHEPKVVLSLSESLKKTVS